MSYRFAPWIHRPNNDANVISTVEAQILLGHYRDKALKIVVQSIEDDCKHINRLLLRLSKGQEII